MLGLPLLWFCLLALTQFDLQMQKVCNKTTLEPGASAHTCNPSYSGGRDQEDCSSKPAQANSFRDPILKKTLHKKGLVEWFMV
jgi:hypothetical protein